MLKRLMRAVMRLGLLLLAVTLLWSMRFSLDHIVVDSETYLVRVNRVSGHADILIPGEGWVPSDETWDDAVPSPPASAS